MTTWTCKGLIAGAVLALAGCDEFGGLTSDTSAEPVLGLTSAQLGRGAVTLVPPSGFCVDKRSLRQSFALMARCDTLGGPAARGAPLALITATTTANTGAIRVSANDLGSSGETILAQSERSSVTLVQVQGTPPDPGMRKVYWRAAGQVGTHVVALAIYEAQGGATLGELAPDLLAQTMQRTQARSSTAVAGQQDNSATSPSN